MNRYNKLILMILLFTCNSIFASFTVLVGKNATVDGSVLLAHNEDASGALLNDLFKVPESFHFSGEMIKLLNGGTIDQVSKTYSYLWLNVNKFEFSDSYMNEWGVTIASSGCPSKENLGETVDGGIGYFLRRIVIERARTAKEAVKIAGEIIEKVGYSSSGRSYGIADQNEAWVLAVVKGKIWIAQRVPDNAIAVIPNYYTIDEFDLNDTTNFLGSKEVISYAIKMGWYNPDLGKNFNFRLTYSNPKDLDAIWNVPRQWQTMNLLSNNQNNYFSELPFSFVPKNKISLSDIMNVLQDHYEGTQFEMNEQYNNGNPHESVIMRICSSTNQYGIVAQLRNWLPVDIGAIMWLAPRRPCIQPFIPIYFGINEIPNHFSCNSSKDALEEHYKMPEEQGLCSQDLSFLQFSDYADKFDSDYGNKINDQKKIKKKFQKNIFENQNSFENKVSNVYKHNPSEAKKMLTEYVTKLSNELLTITKERLVE